MEIKINKEIKEYNETMFFGLSVRQFIFALLACAAAIGVYFSCRQFFGTEILSWLCMISAIPFIFFGFVRYNGMSVERIIGAFIRSEIGKYKVVITDKCGNTTEYDFSIEKGANIGLFVLIGIVVLAAMIFTFRSAFGFYRNVWRYTYTRAYLGAVIQDACATVVSILLAYVVRGVLCIIFGNTLDNAIEACEQISGDTEKIIFVTCKCNSGFVFIDITNPVAENISIHGTNVETSKPDKASHGYGLYSLNKTVKKLDGEVKLSCKNKIFKVEIDFSIEQNIIYA